jgi:hypothetical protein
VKAHANDIPCIFERAVETVQYSLRRFIHTVRDGRKLSPIGSIFDSATQNLLRIFDRLPVVDDDRQVSSRGNCHLPAEELFLCPGRTEIVVIIESDLPDGDNFCVMRQFLYYIRIAVAYFRRLMRVNADRGINFFVFFA